LNHSPKITTGQRIKNKALKRRVYSGVYSSMSKSIDSVVWSQIKMKLMPLNRGVYTEHLDI